MKIVHINPESNNSKEFDNYVKKYDDTFVLVYMENCTPCEATRPQWTKMQDALEKKYAKFNNVMIADVNSAVLKDIKSIANIKGFPTILHIKKGVPEEFEKGKQLNKTRTVDAFISWIELKIKPYEVVNNVSKTGGGQRKTRQRSRTGKGSRTRTTRQRSKSMRRIKRKKSQHKTNH